MLAKEQERKRQEEIERKRIEEESRFNMENFSKALQRHQKQRSYSEKPFFKSAQSNASKLQHSAITTAKNLLGKSKDHPFAEFDDQDMDEELDRLLLFTCKYPGGQKFDIHFFLDKFGRIVTEGG